MREIAINYDFFDINKFLISDNEFEAVYQIPRTVSLDLIGKKEKLMKTFLDVEFGLRRDDPFYTVTCIKKRQNQIE